MKCGFYYNISHSADFFSLSVTEGRKERRNKIKMNEVNNKRRSYKDSNREEGDNGRKQGEFT
jgi:hypothetical protein